MRYRYLGFLIDLATFLNPRWSQKRRDRVDQILVRELHSEESAWTDYAQDEAEVKDQLSENILEVLVVDTVKVLTDVWMKRSRQD